MFNTKINGEIGIDGDTSLSVVIFQLAVWSGQLAVNCMAQKPTPATALPYAPPPRRGIGTPLFVRNDALESCKLTQFQPLQPYFRQKTSPLLCMHTKRTKYRFELRYKL